ncbi:site-specific DNA-methyltransferase [Melioribacter sp. OK-6-Me]|uniref:site-specific DNA-methyltransferase n=1 Tax=unclassified Melioribacter TaxID=2627329 RepID=UPI003EDA30D2
MRKEKVTGDIKVENKDLEILKTHFPHYFDKNGNFDFEKFKNYLTEKEISFSTESYGLEWLGKSYARLLASDPATTLLKADETHNAKPENTNSENLLIKGDNLEVLKHLANAYYEKIKMIYIDPPYNTGNDGFVYNDDRKYTVKDLQNLIGIDEEKAKRILDFTQSKSNSHSAWLTFMYPRLYIAKQLLRDDGVIFVSIDDNEVAQLRLLMDEIFGEENFVAEFPRITKKAGKTTDLIAKNTDYLITYSKTDKLIIGKSSFEDLKYNGIDEYFEERGSFKLSQTLDYSSIQYSKSLDYEIEFDGKIYRPGNVSKEQMEARQKANPKSDFCWRWSKDLFEFGLKNGFIVVKNDRIYTKTYKNAVIKKDKKNGYFIEIQERKKSTSSLEFIDNKYSNDNAKKDISKYFDEKVFEYSKPISLIYKIAQISTSCGDLILDFFAGSGTTGDAVMQLNAEDGGNRKFILVQLPEPIDPKKNQTAYDFVKNELKAEPTIFEITKERLIRAAEKIKTETIDTKIKEKENELQELHNQLDLEDKEEKIKKLQNEIEALKRQDLGFKIFETIPIWEDYNFEAEAFDSSQTLFDAGKLNDEDIQALLTTWKTYDGIPLTEELETIDLGGYTSFYGNGKLYLMHKGFTADHLKALLEKIDTDKHFEPKTIIAFGYHFESARLRELSENVKNYANKKQIDIDFVVRY